MSSADVDFLPQSNSPLIPTIDEKFDDSSIIDPKMDLSESVGAVPPLENVSDVGVLYTDFITRAGELSDKGPTITINGEGDPKTFIEVLNTYPAFKDVIAKFNYPSQEDKSTVVEVGSDKPLLNAFFANDLYKLSMAPVIHHVTLHNEGCTVQFKVDLRIKSTFNEKLKKDYVMTKESTFVTDLVKELDTFKNRVFDNDIFDRLIKPPETEVYPIWKDPNQFLYTLAGRSLIASDRGDIKKFYKNISDVELSDADFHDRTCILNCIPIPKEHGQKNPVVLSVLFSEGVKGVKGVEGVKGGEGVEGVEGDETKGPDIRATGFWPWCSWLETPVMQTAYEVMHRYYLKTILSKIQPPRTNTYGAWMAESLFRTFTGISFLQKEKNKGIKVALFSGRRTGGALFNLLQVYLWDKFDKSGTPLAGGRNLGTSSFWALETLRDLKFQCQIQPSGTHAHELSMTLNVLYGEDLDIPEIGFVGTQILGHLLYKKLSAGKTPTPMLTDTVGTRNFLETAVALKDNETGKDALCSFSSARQDSGTLEDYVTIMRYYTSIAGCDMPILMASEIDERDDDFKTAIECTYKLAGVGGALGDSEKIDSKLVLDIEWKKPVENAFAASEAAKITRVWSGKLRSGKLISGYTLKTGDAIGKDKNDKVTFDKKADTEIVTKLDGRASKFQALQIKAIEVLRKSNPTKEEIESFRFEKMVGEKSIEEIITEKQDVLDLLLESIIKPVGIKGQKRGGRRTRRRARKVTKKRVRKNIRKSKNKKSRRSYRRKSKK
jgi:nicotinic acid phosphoribosyltransferase